jgi:hypothetical protein
MVLAHGCKQSCIITLHATPWRNKVRDYLIVADPEVHLIAELCPHHSHLRYYCNEVITNSNTTTWN